MNSHALIFASLLSVLSFSIECSKGGGGKKENENDPNNN